MRLTSGNITTSLLLLECPHVAGDMIEDSDFDKMTVGTIGEYLLISK